MHRLTRIALVGTSPAVAARVKAALEARGSARDCDPIALVGPVGAPLTATDDQEARNARQAMAYREMLQPGMVPLVGILGMDSETLPITCPKCAGAGERTSGNKCVTCKGSGLVYIRPATRD